MPVTGHACLLRFAFFANTRASRVTTSTGYDDYPVEVCSRARVSPSLPWLCRNLSGFKVTEANFKCLYGDAVC